MKTFMKDLVTESDNETYDYNRVLVILFALLVIFITLWVLFHDGKVVTQLTEWIASILGGGGVANALKGKFEAPSQRVVIPPPRPVIPAGKPIDPDDIK
jgi:hypothetical protein